MKIERSTIEKMDSLDYWELLNDVNQVSIWVVMNPEGTHMEFHGGPEYGKWEEYFNKLETHAK